MAENGPSSNGGGWRRLYVGALSNSFADLPSKFYQLVPPEKAPAPRLVKLNEPLATALRLQLPALQSPEGTELLAGNRLPAGGEPLAMAYAGHQFGGWVPSLGDGRAVLLGETLDERGVRWDIQLKGSGLTKFSRKGDGKAAIGPVLREYLLSEAMHALGVPTTRALAAVATGETVERGEERQPGAVLCRVARSLVRVGTFEYFNSRGDLTAVRQLADYVLWRSFPELSRAEAPVEAVFTEAVRLQAELVAAWLAVGFIHGVMNTDNCTLVGDTIDYGPCAFMDYYKAATVYSSIDIRGRYAYCNQPRVAQWNLSRLLLALTGVLGPDGTQRAAKVLNDDFPRLFEAARLRRFRAKLGLSGEEEDDEVLIDALLAAMEANRADFTLTFRRLSSLPREATPSSDAAVGELFDDPTAFDRWAVGWRTRLATAGAAADEERQAAMRRTNPAYIPRNHEVQRAIVAAERGDFGEFEALLAVVTQPWEEQRESQYGAPPKEDEVVQRTFCGT